MDKFKIINNSGNTYDVMPKGYSVSNFGYSNIAQYSRIGNRYVNTMEYLSQQQPKFSICFPLETAEVDYLNFVMFLQNAPLKLLVEYDNLTFYQNIRIDKVSKNWLPVELIEATIEVFALTPFYRMLSAFTGASETVNDGKTYDYTYDYVYTDSVPMSVYLDCNTYIDSPVRFAIYGPCVNPTWSYYRNGELISNGKLNAIIPDNRKVVISTIDIPYSIKMYDFANNEIGDLYGLSDFSTDRFLYFGNGRNRITVNQEDTNNVSISVEANIYYASI